MDERTEAIKEITGYEMPVPVSFSWQDAYNQTKLAVLSHQPVILFGPPGTGKTKLIYDLKKELENESKLGNFEVVQFHRKFSYEDFIEGYTPSDNGNFSRHDGIFKAFAKNSSESEVDLFIIDEINRAEITTTFGELMFLIEDREERKVKTSHFGEEIGIPGNLSLVGTMNTADRNIASLDFALRRRFKFIPLFPDYTVLENWLNQRGLGFENFTISDYVIAVKNINTRIRNNRLMGRNMQVGHSMWVPKGTGLISEDDLTNLFQFEIVPQLEAYLGFGNENQLAEMLNTNIAANYLNQKRISFEDVAALVRDLVNEQSR
jgi:5-methylcytosine-specific restriction protein B